MVYVRSNIPDSVAGIDRLIGDWVDSVCAAMVPALQAQVARAAVHACRAHTATAPVDNGEAISRCVAVADILAELDLDHETLIAALLHDLPPDDPHAPLPALAKAYGDRVAHLIDGVRRMGAIEELYEAPLDARRQLQNAENLRKLLLAMAEDVRVVLIKLADRLHTMRRLPQLDDEVRRQAVAQATMEIYAPLANRLGVWQIKWELEDLAFRHLDPLAYRQIATYLDERRVDREAFIHEVIERLLQALEGTGIEARISGRPKHLYSIWRKMQRKRVDIDGIFDLRAVRIMVDHEDDCYTALSVVHSLWPYIPDEFDDYISKPKGNLYRSLHTAVTGPDGKVLEVQIRTQEMHQHAEYGIAAHWAYKEAAGHDAAFQRRIVLMRNWLERTLEAEPLADASAAVSPDSGVNGDPSPAGESAAATHQEVAASIYVLTPQAKVVELPPGATPLDFAYAIHSEVGHHCRGARVDGRIVPLTHKLASGETVEIITQKNAAPSRDWLSVHHGYLTTSRARNRVRQWFKQQDYDRHLSEGRSLLDKELTRLGIETKVALDQLAERFNLQRGDDVLAAIGRGDLAVGAAARQVGEPRHERRDASAESEPSTPLIQSRRKRQHQDRPEVIVAGVPDLMTQIASCCHPVPDDPIIGFITRGRGVAVHRANCPNITSLGDEEQERLIEVNWAEQPNHAAYPVDIVITAADRRGLLRDVSSVLADEEANVIATETQTDKAHDRASMRFRVEVSDVDQLEQVCAKLRQLSDVIEVRRSGG